MSMLEERKYEINGMKCRLRRAPIKDGRIENFEIENNGQGHYTIFIKGGDFLLEEAGNRLSKLFPNIRIKIFPEIIVVGYDNLEQKERIKKELERISSVVLTI